VSRIFFWIFFIPHHIRHIRITQGQGYSIDKKGRWRRLAFEALKGGQKTCMYPWSVTAGERRKGHDHVGSPCQGEAKKRFFGNVSEWRMKERHRDFRS